jgi:hypothetical protein
MGEVYRVVEEVYGVVGEIEGVMQGERIGCSTRKPAE